MGLDNVAVQWPRTGRFYDPVAPAEFVDFAELADTPDIAAPTAALAGHIAKTGTVRATAYTELVDLLLGPRRCALRHRGRRRGRGPGDRPRRLRLDRRRPGAVRRRARSRYGEPVTFDTRRRGAARGAGRRRGWPSSSCAGSTRGSTRCATSRATRRSGASPARSSPCCRASTAAAPSAASPSTPTSESLRLAPLGWAAALRPAAFTLRAPSTSCRRPRAPGDGGRLRRASRPRAPSPRSGEPDRVCPARAEQPPSGCPARAGPPQGQRSSPQVARSAGRRSASLRRVARVGRRRRRSRRRRPARGDGRARRRVLSAVRPDAAKSDDGGTRPEVRNDVSATGARGTAPAPRGSRVGHRRVRCRARSSRVAGRRASTQP